MSKRKKKKRSVSKSRQQVYRYPTPEVQSALEQAEAWLSEGRPLETIELLGPLLEAFPRIGDLHYTLAFALAQVGDPWGALEGYERAVKLSQVPDYWVPLATLYMYLELDAHALRAFERVFGFEWEEPPFDEASVREAVASLQEDVAQRARDLNLEWKRFEQGLYYAETGQIALRREDFAGGIAACRKAVRLVPDWPPPYNNLSLAQFWDGHPQAAVATARRALERHPENVHALSNTIRFLTWTGDKAEALDLWERLERLEPQNDDERLKMAEAAACMGQDEHVYRWVRPVVELGERDERTPELDLRAQLFLAVAEANLGQPGAEDHLRELQDLVPWAGDLLSALQEGRPGPGWAERFPYFHSTELIPRQAMEHLIELIEDQDERAPHRFRRQIARFMARFPQIVLVAEKLIWEEGYPNEGSSILTVIDTPSARAALRRFGLSQVGEDEARTQALLHLLHAGEIEQGTMLRLWLDGEWREVELRGYEVSAERDARHDPEVERLMERGLEAFQQQHYDRAEDLFQRCVQLAPHAKDAHNNLGTLYAYRGEHDRAKEAFQAAIEIDPLYVFPRCNLAHYLLDDGDDQGAEAMIAPLARVERFHPQEVAFYSFTQARIMVYREDYKEARKLLRMGLEIYPEYEPSRNLLEKIETVGQLQARYDSFWERQLQRRRARRERLQAKLSTPDPELVPALSLYTKNALTGMGHLLILGGGWSALRKAELIELIVQSLLTPGTLEDALSDLEDEEREALRLVLDAGGSMPWQKFDARYGNDVDESPYWQWHDPETLMGHLRVRGLLVEAVVDGVLRIAVPVELRPRLGEIL